MQQIAPVLDLVLGLRSVHDAFEYRLSHRCIRRNVGPCITSQEVVLLVLFYPVFQKENEDGVFLTGALFQGVGRFRYPPD